MLYRERQVASGTEGLHSFMSPFARLLPQETYGAIMALRTQGSTLTQLRDIFTSEQAIIVREYIQQTQPRKIGIQPISSYQALFTTAAIEPPEKQIRALIIYGNYHHAEEVAKSFSSSFSRNHLSVTFDDCITEAFTVGLQKAVDAVIQSQEPPHDPEHMASFLKQAIHNRLIDYYRYEKLHIQSPVTKDKRGEPLYSTQVLSEESHEQPTSGSSLFSVRQESDPEAHYLRREKLEEIGTTINTLHLIYRQVFYEVLEGASISELMKKYDKSEAAMKMIIYRAFQAIKHLNPDEDPVTKIRQRAINSRNPALRKQKDTPT